MTTSRGKKSAAKEDTSGRRPSGALAKPDVPFAWRLVRALSGMIEAAQKEPATVADVALTARHRQIGHHGRTQVLEGRGAEDGGLIVPTASRQSRWIYFGMLAREGKRDSGSSDGVACGE